MPDALASRKTALARYFDRRIALQVIEKIAHGFLIAQQPRP